MAIDDLETLSFWQNRLDEIQEELSLMTGRPGFSVAGLQVNEAENYERLRGLQAEAEEKIEALGGGNAGTRNVVYTDGPAGF